MVLLLFLTIVWLTLANFWGRREAVLKEPRTLPPVLADKPPTSTSTPVIVQFKGLEYAVFGLPQQTQSLAPEPATLPVTQLQLYLSGTFGHSNSGTSSAIIATPRDTAEQYFIGDTLPGGAHLHSVHQDAVVLQTANGLETLFINGHIALDAGTMRRMTR